MNYQEFCSFAEEIYRRQENKKNLLEETARIVAKSELEKTILSLLPHDYGEEIDVEMLCQTTGLDAHEIVQALEGYGIAEERNEGKWHFVDVGGDVLAGSHPTELFRDPGREWMRYTGQNRAKGRHPGAA